MSLEFLNQIPIQAWLGIGGGLVFAVGWVLITRHRALALVRRWATLHQFTIIRATRRTIVPFATPTKGHFFRVQLADSSGGFKHGWLRFRDATAEPAEVEVDLDEKTTDHPSRLKVRPRERMTREEIINHLQELPIEELIDILREVLPLQKTGTSTPSSRADRLILAVASRNLDPDCASEPPCTLEAVAYPNPDGLGPDWGLCQDGSCSTCRIPVCSNEKRGICPSCGNSVSMT